MTNRDDDDFSPGQLEEAEQDAKDPTHEKGIADDSRADQGSVGVPKKRGTSGSASRQAVGN